MKTVAIIQARMGSTRLPGKVLKDLCGKPVLWHVIQRVKACSQVDEIVIATTVSPQDDQLVKAVESWGVTVFRGSERDVLARYYEAAKQVDAETVVRITSDCPLYDPNILDSMLAGYYEMIDGGERVDYLSNVHPRTFPRGLDTEILPFRVLAQIQMLAVTPDEREHVTRYIYKYPDEFCMKNYQEMNDFSEHRWTLDTEEDWKLIQAVYGQLYKPEQIFSTKDILDAFKTFPEWKAINADVVQKA